ncbi:outer membrane beta-barrel protein [Piscinibacter defluvii]|uniref:outer membrane beta-barrel protein n=1 Tax=Piscinibacter defluvii TaxID=1796922 RepID=UPI000FDD0C37|nr:outer membrane beta-barrel protein [Piscinibacter defluvii]
MKTIVRALTATALLAAFAAHAEGLSIGGSIGESHWKGDDVGGVATDRKDTSYKLYGGYGFTPNLGVELGYANFGKFSSGAGSVKADGLYLDGVGTLPLGAGFSALGRVGVFNGKLDSSLAGSDRGTNVKVGAGLQYDFDKNTALRAEWERYRFDALDTKANTDLYSIGVNYRF